MSLSVVVWKDPSENLIIEDYQPALSHHTASHTNSKSRNWCLSTETTPQLPSSLFSHYPQMGAELEHHKFLADLLHLQTSCNHPAMKGLIEYLLKLKCELSNTKIKNAQLEHLIANHSEALFQDIACDLYEKIKESPRLKKKLEQLKQDENNIEFNTLIDKLEMSYNASNSTLSLHKLCENWTWVEPNKDPILVDIDIAGLDELQYQIHLLETAGRSAGNPQQFYLDMEVVRKETQSKPSFQLGRTLYRAGEMTWQVIQGVCAMVSFLRSAAPSVLFVAPLILPLPWLRIIQFLLRVFI